MSEKYKNLKVKDLQELLQKQGIPHSGKKEELIERLVKHDEAQELATLEEEFGDLEEFDESKLDLTDIKPIEDEEIKPIEDELKDITKEAVTIETKETSTATTNSTPAPLTKSSSNFKFTPITFDKKEETTPAAPVAAPAPVAVEKESPTPVAAASPTGKPPVDDAEKALERAKRFGIQLNEKAKKDIRAQRFGIPAATTPSNTKTTPNNKPKSKGIDPEVLKKRAERFGTASTTTANNNSSKGKVPVTVDPADEEKKRKRAERFNSDANKKQKAE